MAKVIEGLYYSESHEYVKIEGDFAYVGITDYAQNALALLLFVIFARKIWLSAVKGLLWFLSPIVFFSTPLLVIVLPLI